MSMVGLVCLCVHPMVLLSERGHINTNKIDFFFFEKHKIDINGWSLGKNN